jgi:thiamine-monophosphate kinase
MKLNETSIIKKYFKPLIFKNTNSLNLKDDIYFDKKNNISFSTDTYVENIHFLNSRDPKYFVKKIFRSSISDIFCKGLKPITYFLNLSLKKTSSKWLKSFTSELKRESKKYKIFLGGGDLTKSKTLSISISVLANSKKKPILRSGAKIKDDIYISGNLGDSYLGLLVSLRKINLGKFNKYFEKAFLEPKLPIKFSTNLYKFASSSIDISDGLIKDLSSLCDSSKCGAKIFFKDIPFSKNATRNIINQKIKAMDIFSKGDDYQLLFTASRKNRKIIISTAKRTFTKITRVGTIISKKKVKLIYGDKIIDSRSIKSSYIHEF